MEYRFKFGKFVVTKYIAVDFLNNLLFAVQEHRNILSNVVHDI